MMNFDEFIASFQTNGCCEGSVTAKRIYEFLGSEESRIKMAEISNAGITALSAVAEDVCKIAYSDESDFLLDTKLHRQTIGRMISACLEDLGYVATRRARVLTKNATPFTTAHVYELDEAHAKEIIVKKIVRR